MLTFLSVLFSQETGEDFYLLTPLSMDDGLSGNSVYCMLQDSAGYMWFGTFSGLNRYDGRGTTVFRPRIGDPQSISGSVIFALLEDSRGRIWVGTDGGGLSRFNRENLTFTSYRNDPCDKLSLPGDQIFALEEDRMGRVWIGTAGGGLCFYRENEELFFILNRENSALVSDRIRTLYCDGEGILWIGTEKGLSRYNTNSGRFLFPEDDFGLPDDLFIRDIKADSSGNVWIGSKEGLFLYDRSIKRAKAFPMPEKVDVRSFIFDEDRLWIGTERTGAYVYDIPAGTWTLLHADGNKGSLNYDKIRCLYKDPDGLVWIGTRGGGINIYNPAGELVDNYTQIRDIRHMTERNDGSLWIGTDGSGIGVLDRETGRIDFFDLNPADRNSDNDHVYSFLEDSRGNLWVGTDGSGLYYLDEGNAPAEVRRYPLKEDTDGSSRMTVWAISEDSEGAIWVGTEGDGLYALRDGTISQYKHDSEDQESMNGNAVRCIYEDSHERLWVGTWDGGLNLFHKDSETFTRFVRSATQANSLSDNSVNVIHEDSRGRLWIGTSGAGVDIYLPEENIFRNLSVRDGLAGNNIYGILEDESQNIWLSSDRGLSRISAEDDSILNFSQADGLTSGEFSQNAFLRTKDGTFFWGSPKGISSFHPEMLPRLSHPSEIVITGLSINNLPVGIGEETEGIVILDKDISLKDKIVLPHTANNLTFRFSLLSFIDPEKHHYAVQLLGLEERPRFLGNISEVSYAMIPPGTYTLRISGTDHNGLYADQEKDLEIQILAPFWMHLWFLILSLLIVFGLVALGFLLRLKILHRNNAQLRAFSIHMENAREEERKAAAREYHDELGQHLTAMKFGLFWLNSHPDAQENIKREKIAALLDMADESIVSVRSLSTNLRPTILDNLTLKEAIEWKSRRFTKRTGIPVNLDMRMKGLAPYDPDGEIKTAVFRMYQEILTNILRHSGADRVDVKVVQSKDEFRLFARDNGGGIARESERNNSSFGLIGMRERCRHYKGSFLIDNYPDGGTFVRIVLPLKERKHEKNSHCG